MPEPVSQLELTVPADDFDEAVERVCAQWGVARDAVEVEVLPDQPDTETLRIRVTRLSADAPSSLALEDAPENLALEDAPENEPAQPAANDDNDAQLARQVLLDLLERMEIGADVQATRGEPDGDLIPIILDVQGDDLGLLIGRKGETLAALQYLARLIVAKQVGHSVDLVVDVQGHKKRREEQLRRMALRMAEQAVQRQRTMTLEPMAPNERRIVHLALRDHPGVTTESVGDGSQRKVTIIPRPPAA